MINICLKIAMQAHMGQKRKTTNFPYIVHPIEVATIYATYYDDEIGYCTALLHDVIEDSELTEQSLTDRLVLEGIEKSIAKTIASDVESLSKDGSNYNTKLRTASVTAKLVKLCDISSNCRDLLAYKTPDKARVYANKKMRNLEALSALSSISLYANTRDLIEIYDNIK